MSLSIVQPELRDEIGIRREYEIGLKGPDPGLLLGIVLGFHK